MPTQPEAQVFLHPKIKHTHTVSYPSLTALDKKFSHHQALRYLWLNSLLKFLSLSLSILIQPLPHNSSYSLPCCACGCVPAAVFRLRGLQFSWKLWKCCLCCWLVFHLLLWLQPIPHFQTRFIFLNPSHEILSNNIKTLRTVEVRMSSYLLEIMIWVP